MPSESDENTGRYWHEHEEAWPLPYIMPRGLRWERACDWYPDMRDEGRGYRDCPGVCLNDMVCARLGKSIADFLNG
jgi:hypothetical protein